MPHRLAITAPFAVDVIPYDEPPLQPSQIRVKSELASAKHGTNVSLFEGTNFTGQRFDPKEHIFRPADATPAPATAGPRALYGTMAVGTVSEIGPAVTRWQIGDRVFGPLDVRETNVCSENDVWALGPIDPELALCLEPAYVAFFSVRESGVRFGDSVVVVGLGAIGLLTVRMARLAGAETVIAADPLPHRRAVAMALGADHACDPRACDLGEEAHRLTGGQGADVAVEVAGRYEALHDAIRCTRVGGTVCMTGFYQGPAQAVWFGREAHHNRLTFVVPHGCGWANLPREYPRWDERRAYDALVSLMRQGKFTAPGIIQPIVTLEEAPQVWDWIAKTPEKVIKFAVRF
jgi:threonine dehydrogenase-like Zn-dependent dehydrogenase